MYLLVATFAAVAVMLGVNALETRLARARVAETLDVQDQVTSLRVWINRGSTNSLAFILGADLGSEANWTEDEATARAAVVHLRSHFTGDPEQLARVVELERLIAARSVIEHGAMAAAREGGPAAGHDVLAASNWSADRARVRSITSTMLADIRRNFQLGEERYSVVIQRLRLALGGFFAVMVGTFVFLLYQLRVSRQSREEARLANELAQERLVELEAVLDTVPAAVLIARDPGCLRMDGNRFALEMMRAPPGANLSLSAPPDGRRAGVRYLKDGVEIPPDSLPVQVAAFQGVTVEGAQLEVLFEDGTIRHLLARARPLLDGSGVRHGAVGAFVDVTEPVRMARELLDALEENKRLLASARRGELLYREMARNFPNGAIALFDRDLRFLVFDGTQFAIRRDAASNVGRTLFEIFPPDVAARIAPVHRDAIDGREGRIEAEINGRNIQIHACPVRDETGAVIMGIATSQDVTEERSLRTQLAVSSRLASLGTLVAGVAHEVNNPLAGTLASLATAIVEQREISARLRGGGPLDREGLAAASDEVVEILLDAQVGGDRITRIVKDLALFGRPNPMRTRVRLGDVVTASMRWLPASVGRMATVRVDDLGAPDVHGSSGQLEQVVVNLVTNAAHSIPEDRRGEVAIRISESERGGAALEVKDNGKGIDPATMERIFDPFFTTREVGHGMGLGLPICHAIVTAHGGTLTATSLPGKGSTFRLELPPADAVE
jgi:signal transduction histidine kinase